jgi:hypothetical protein
MTPGDFAWCPAGTIHAFQFVGNFTRMLGLNLPGGFERFFDLVGTPYQLHVLAEPQPFPTPEQFRAASEQFDVVYLREYDLGAG